MGFRVQGQYEKAEEDREREFVVSLSPANRLRFRIWQLSGIGIIVCLLSFFIFLMVTARSAPIESSGIEVLDGDTIRVGVEVYRLVGFDTPEGGLKAKCEVERTLAASATFRLRQIVTGGGLDLERVKCSCRSDTEGTSVCNHGRLCGVLKARGKDVGAMLIGEGLAREYVCGRVSCPRRLSWC
jgi:hypothetical protein